MLANLLRHWSRGNRVIADRYLTRHYLLPGVFLHEYHGPDYAEVPHDHPWSWAFSLVLSGGYWERTSPWPKSGLGRLVQVRWFNWFGPNKVHEIVKVKPGTSTLFVHGPRVKDWGFWCYKDDLVWRHAIKRRS